MKLHPNVTSTQVINRFNRLEKDFRRVHGNTYSYENVIYKGAQIKVSITCKKHGDFLQKIGDHISSQAGCPKCAKIKAAQITKKPVKDFIEEASKVHNNKYIYSKVSYTNNRTPVTITCPVHGDFKQRPKEHINGHGCVKCTKEKQSIEKERLNKSSFIERATKVHGNKYIYNIATYISNTEKMPIKCKLHGYFNQAPREHLHGQGCPKCGYIKSGNKLRETQEYFLRNAKIVHGDTYTYENVVYKGANTKVNITCKVHGSFSQKPASHLAGRGCSKCSKNGFNIKKPGLLYYIKLSIGANKYLYKIGITNKSVQERFGPCELNNITILKETWYKLGEDALKKEQSILKKYKKYKYLGDNVLKSGNTELFTEDVLQLDNKEKFMKLRPYQQQYVDNFSVGGSTLIRLDCRRR